MKKSPNFFLTLFIFYFKTVLHDLRLTQFEVTSRTSDDFQANQLKSMKFESELKSIKFESEYQIKLEDFKKIVIFSEFLNFNDTHF